MVRDRIAVEWLEEGDQILVKGQEYVVYSIDGDDPFNLTIIDSEGYKKLLTLPSQTNITVLYSIDD